MTQFSDNNKRIAKNTLVLYFRMMFMMAVSLYTSRVILNALGFEDYGIYSVVGGFVAMFGIISNSLTAAISRFLTYTIGQGNSFELSKVFGTSLIIQSVLAIIIVVLIETIGIWFLNYHMTIPHDRLTAANWVLQFSVLTFVVQLISVPYNAAIIAHERMTAYAFISILNTLGNLLVALCISYTSSIDRLIFYSALLTAVVLIIRFIYGWYCGKNFQECKFHFIIDKVLLKKILSFAGWNFFGASSSVLRDQGINVLLNIFCGPVVNAARGIAMQVSSAIRSFSSSFLSAIDPQITKQYASGRKNYAFSLCFMGAKFGSYLLLLLSLPIFAETEQILTLWLGNIPPHTVNFVRLIILYVMIECVSSTLITLMLATGNIKRYQIIVGGIQLFNFPFALLLLYLRLSPEYTMVATILLAIACMICRLHLLQSMIALPVKLFVKEVVGNICLVAICASIIPTVILISFEACFVRLLFSVLLCFIFTIISIVFVGCKSSERNMIFEKIHQKIKRR